ncbi:hypothetical protein ACGFX4_15925 [Kitasatospora sp. NPDC048365]|uniref:hypothetical protein n=1 Tax=Kitasatospora sp. NPDC048365 TaxID=3364050 RepID=UPI00371C6E9F
MSPRAGRLGVISAVVTPLALIGLGALGSNSDYTVVSLITGTLVFCFGSALAILPRTSTWLVLLMVPPGMALLLGVGPAIQSEVLVLSGVHTSVVVTAAHSSKGKNDRVSWTCDLRRTDGLPLPHAFLDQTSGCYGRSDVGRTLDVLVDPAGWVPPGKPEDLDREGLKQGIPLLAVATALLAVVPVLARRTRPRAAGR